MKFVSVLVLSVLFLASCTLFGEASSELCFVGDSITDNWDTDYYFSTYKIYKHAVAGSTLEDAFLWDVSNCAGLSTVLLIGTNNIPSSLLNDTLSDDFIQDFSEKYVTLVKSFKASKVHAISILPRNRNHAEKASLNEQIKRLNNSVKSALKNSSIELDYLDIYDYFLNDDGSLHFDYYTDGLHLSPEGYELLSYKVRESL